MPEKKKKSRKATKPDEVFEAGPVRVARFGRVTVIESNWDPEDFKRWKARWPEFRTAAEGQVRAASSRLQATLRRVRGADILATLLTRFGLTDPTTYVESEADGGEHFSEYVASLVAAIPASELGTDPLIEGEFSTVLTDLKELFKAAQTSAEMSVDPDDKAQLAGFRMQLVLKHLYVRGDSYPAQHTDLFREFVTPHADFLQSAHGFSALELIDTLDAIEKQFDDRIKRSFGATRLLQLAIEAASSEEEAREKLSPEELAEISAVFATSPTEFLRIDAGDPGVSVAVLEKLACTPGENSKFLTGPFGGFPMNDSLVAAKPLLKLDGMYICPSPIILFRSYFNVATRLLDQAPYRERFQAKRGRLLEDVSVRHLSQILKGANVHRSLYYTASDGRRCETDAIILFDRHVFVVEAKAGGLSPATRRGAPLKIQSDFTKLIGDAFEQGARVRDYILTRELARFEDEHGNLLLELLRTEIDEVYVVNPTLTVVDPIGAQLGAARELGLLDDGDVWPWCVFINDLRIISELVHSPAEFTLYLRRRLKLNQTPMAPHDELDLFCKFFSDGLYFEKREFDGLGRVVPHAFSDILDRWYIGRLHGATVDKPTFPLPPQVRSLTDAIEGTTSGRRTTAARTLMEFGSEALDQFEAFLLRYKRGVLAVDEHHDLSFFSRDLKIGITIHVSRLGRLENAAVAHGRKRRHMSGAPEWLVIAYSPDSGHCEFVFAGKEPLSENDLRHVDDIRRALLTKHLEHHGHMPTRNEPCPCLSGKKYKKCCVDLSP